MVLKNIIEMISTSFGQIRIVLIMQRRSNIGSSNQNICKNLMNPKNEEKKRKVMIY